MSNEFNVIRGLVPKLQNGMQPVTQLVQIDSGNTVDLFLGSPYYLVSGKLRAILLSGTEATDKDAAVRGTIIKLMDTNQIVVNSLDSGLAGWAEVTYLQDQEYIITMNGTGYSGIGDSEITYNFKAETRSASTDRFASRGRSGIQLDSAQGHATDNQFVVKGLTDTVNNAGGVDTCEVWGIIRPALWQNA